MKSSFIISNLPDTRARRVGRLPLPPHVTELTPRDEPALGAADAFVDALCELPFATWLDVGCTIMADGASLPARALACSHLDAAIASNRLAIAAWRVRDAVDTAAFLRGHGVGDWTRASRRAFAAAHGAAEDAALASLARQYLSAADYATLSAPFTRLLASRDRSPAPTA